MEGARGRLPHLDAVLRVAQDGVDEPQHGRQARAARQQPCTSTQRAAGSPAGVQRVSGQLPPAAARLGLQLAMHCSRLDRTSFRRLPKEEFKHTAAQHHGTRSPQGAAPMVLYLPGRYTNLPKGPLSASLSPGCSPSSACDTSPFGYTCRPAVSPPPLHCI